jgi:chromatin remodeling complex protein RSC6
MAGTLLASRAKVMDTPMSSEQMQVAIRELQDTMVVMAHIEKKQSEHISELIEFRIQSEKLQLESEKFRKRTEENLSEITDKLNGLIGYVAGQKPAPPQG